MINVIHYNYGKTLNIITACGMKDNQFPRDGSRSNNKISKDWNKVNCRACLLSRVE